MNRLALAAAVALAACSSTTPGPEPVVSVATGQAGGLAVDLLTRTALRTGLTPVWLAVSAGGQPVVDATVELFPWMEMTDGSGHSAPVLAPPALDADGRYRTDVVFQMASGAAGAWTARVTVTRPGAAPVEVALAVEVVETGRARPFLYVDPATLAETRFLASLNLDGPAVVGLNPVTVTLHEMADPSTFLPVNDATLHLATWMPSMGHGGGACVDPVPVAEGAWAARGVYAGEEAFSMPGDWETTLSVARAGVLLGEPRFSIYF